MVSARTPGFASTQWITLRTPPRAFNRWADAERLSKILHDYFSVAERCTRGLVCIQWRVGNPRFVALWPRVTLLATGEPTYELADARRAIRVAVVGGLVVDPASAARLSIVLERRAQSVHASVELVDYQPRFWRLPVLWWLYGHTQAVVHAWVGRRYLRHLYQECLQGVLDVPD